MRLGERVPVIHLMVRTRARRYPSFDILRRESIGDLASRVDIADVVDRVVDSRPPGRDPSSRAIAARVDEAVERMSRPRRRRMLPQSMGTPSVAFGGFPDQGPMSDSRSDVPVHRTIQLPLTGQIGDGSLTSSNRNAKLAAAGLAGAGLAWLGKKIYDRVKASSRKKAGPVRGNLLIVI